MSITEQNIVSGLINGEENTYILLFDQYYVQLCSFSRKYVGRKDIAEEIVSDVFFKLWENRENLKISTSLRAYLFKSTLNNSLLYLRKLEKEKKLEEYFSDEAVDNIEFSFTQEESPANIKEGLFRNIEEAIGQLPPQQQTAFKLKRFEGKKTKEIAETMGLSPKTVEMHISKAMLNLREKLKNSAHSFLLFMLLGDKGESVG